MMSSSILLRHTHLNILLQDTIDFSINLVLKQSEEFAKRKSSGLEWAVKYGVCSPPIVVLSSRLICQLAFQRIFLLPIRTKRRITSQCCKGIPPNAVPQIRDHQDREVNHWFKTKFTNRMTLWPITIDSWRQRRIQNHIRQLIIRKDKKTRQGWHLGRILWLGFPRVPGRGWHLLR